MATLTLRLEVDPVTKKKNVWVKYDSDSDALPHEHEEEHKRLVQAVLGSGAVKPDELGTIRVEREGKARVAAEAEPNVPEPAAEKLKT